MDKKCQIQNNLNPILKGLNDTVDVVKTTMGAQGKVVIIQEEGKLRFTKDGVSVAKSITMEDPMENIGCEIVKSAASKTVSAVGDGTTATSVLLQAIVNETFNKTIEDVNAFVNEMEEEVNAICFEIAKRSIEVTKENIKSIATIASNSEKLGDLLDEVYTKVGFDHLVSLEMSQEEFTVYEVLEGLEYNRGYVHPGFANTDQDLAVYDNCIVFPLNERLNTATDSQIEDVMRLAISKKVPILLMARDFNTATKRDLILTKQKMGANIIAVKLPGYTERAVNENIADIFSFLTPQDMEITDGEIITVGVASRVTVGPNFTRIYNDNDKPFLQERIDELKAKQSAAIDLMEESEFVKRINNLRSSTAVIFAGGVTEQAAQEEFDRLDDALGSVKAAIKGGYVAGGGLTYYNISKERVPISEGAKVINKAIQQPIKQILSNANVSVDITLYNIKDYKGYDVRNHKYINFVEQGIIDPAEVLIQALKNAFSMSKLLISTSYALNISYERNKLFQG